MMVTPEIREITPTPYLGIRRRVRPQELGPALGAILPAVFARLGALGVQPASPPLMIYLEHDEKAGEFEILGGVFLDSPLDGDDTFEGGTIPAGEAASALHVGPYEELGKAHDALRKWIGECGRRPAGPCWDIYRNDPGAVSEPARYETEVVYLLSPRA